MIDEKIFDFVSQMAHLLFGAVIIFGPLAIGMPQVGLWWCIGFLLVFSAVKEFWYDEKYETPEVRGSSLKDFLFYNLGSAGAVALYFMFHGKI